MANTAADLLIERLIDWDVDTIFGLPGDGINGLFESLRTHEDQIRFIQVRHEEAAALAACGYAKYSGRLGVCLATSGPGGIHLLNGLYDAKMDGQPVLAITGHTFHDLIGTRQQQDVDHTRIFEDVAVYTERISSPAHVEPAVDEAIRLALSHRGVAALTIPKDTQLLSVENAHRSKRNVKEHSAALFEGAAPVPSQQLLQQAADVIDQGRRVAILVGRGALNAGNEVVQLAERVAGPVVKALLGKGVLPDNSPYTTGGIGLLGTAPSQEAFKECDTLVIIGSSLPYIEFYPKADQAKSVQIDIDPSRIGLRFPADVGLVGDSKAVLQALLPLIERKENRSFLETAQERMSDWRKLMKSRGTRMDIPLKPQVVTYHLNPLLNDDALITTDSGTIATWAARYLDMRGTMQFSVSGMLATMACGLPYAIGAALAHPGRQVVAIIGDGGFTMLMGELATIAKYNLPVKVIIFKNDQLGQIKWEQIVLEGNPEFGIDLYPIDFAGFAQNCNVPGFRLDDPQQAESILRDALAHDGPAVVEAVVDPQEPPMPGHISSTQALHFAEAMLKGQEDRWEIIKSIAEDKVREVI